MTDNMRKIRRIVTFLFVSVFFLTFYDGYKAQGPSRAKFKKLGEDTVDLTNKEIAPSANKLKQIVGDKRFKGWVGWWNRCVPNFSLDTMEDIVETPFYDKEISANLINEALDGPGKQFFSHSPGGKYYIDPFWERLSYKKEGGDWQPYIKLPCAVALYSPDKKTAKNILECSALEGMDDIFWIDKNRFVLMGYAAVTRQMDVSCEGTKSCVSPTIWIGDVSSETLNEHRGPTILRSKCEVGDYLKLKFPKFYGTPK